MIKRSFNYLIPYDENDLIRVGNKSDGGYVISKKSLEKDHFLLSFGMSNDWSFEEEFVKFDLNNFVNIYDHTVDLNFFLLRLYKPIKRLFYFKSSFKNIANKTNELFKYLRLKKSKITHYKKKISDDQSFLSKNLSESILDANYPGKIMLKMDIEGDEFNILKDINLHSEKIHTLIVEFHDLDIRLIEFEILIKEIQKKYYIIHIHGNNITGVLENGLPKTLEVTFLNRNDFFKDNKQSRFNFPIEKLDFLNHPYMEDIKINFEKTIENDISDPIL